MPAARTRAQRLTIRQVLDTAIELEKKTMALYVAFVKAFPRPEEIRNFWFTMAAAVAGKSIKPINSSLTLPPLILPGQRAMNGMR